MSKKQGTRIQLVVGEKSVERIERLKPRLQDNTTTNLSERAYHLFDVIAKQLDAGKEIIVQNPDGTGGYPLHLDMIVDLLPPEEE